MCVGFASRFRFERALKEEIGIRFNTHLVTSIVTKPISTVHLAGGRSNHQEMCLGYEQYNRTICNMKGGFSYDKQTF